MKIMGFEVREDHYRRLNLDDIYEIAVEQGYSNPLKIEDFASSDEGKALLLSREWMLTSDHFADTVIVLKYCEKIHMEFMFDVYYALGI